MKSAWRLTGLKVRHLLKCFAGLVSTRALEIGKPPHPQRLQTNKESIAYVDTDLGEAVRSSCAFSEHDKK